MPTSQRFWHSDLIPRSTELWNFYWTLSHTHVSPPLSGGSAAAGENCLLCDSQYYQLLGMRGESQFNDFTWFQCKWAGICLGFGCVSLTAVVFSYIKCLQFFSQTLHDFCRLPQKLNCIQVENIVGFGDPSSPFFGFDSSAAEGWVQVSIFVCNMLPAPVCCVPGTASSSSGTACLATVWLPGRLRCVPLAWAALHGPAQHGQSKSTLTVKGAGAVVAASGWYCSPLPWWRGLICFVRILEDVLTALSTWVANFPFPTKKLTQTIFICKVMVCQPGLLVLCERLCLGYQQAYLVWLQIIVHCGLEVLRYFCKEWIKMPLNCLCFTQSVSLEKDFASLFIVTRWLPWEP